MREGWTGRRRGGLRWGGVLGWWLLAGSVLLGQEPVRTGGVPVHNPFLRLCLYLVVLPRIDRNRDFILSAIELQALAKADRRATLLLADLNGDGQVSRAEIRQGAREVFHAYPGNPGGKGPAGDLPERERLLALGVFFFHLHWLGVPAPRVSFYREENTPGLLAWKLFFLMTDENGDGHLDQAEWQRLIGCRLAVQEPGSAAVAAVAGRQGTGEPAGMSHPPEPVTRVSEEKFPRPSGGSPQGEAQVAAPPPAAGVPGSSKAAPVAGGSRPGNALPAARGGRQGGALPTVGGPRPARRYLLEGVVLSDRGLAEPARNATIRKLEERLSGEKLLW